MELLLPLCRSIDNAVVHSPYYYRGVLKSFGYNSRMSHGSGDWHPVATYSHLIGMMAMSPVPHWAAAPYPDGPSVAFLPPRSILHPYGTRRHNAGRPIAVKGRDPRSSLDPNKVTVFDYEGAGWRSRDWTACGRTFLGNNVIIWAVL